MPKWLSLVITAEYGLLVYRLVQTKGAVWFVYAFLGSSGRLGTGSPLGAEGLPLYSGVFGQPANFGYIVM